MSQDVDKLKDQLCQLLERIEHLKKELERAHQHPIPMYHPHYPVYPPFVDWGRVQQYPGQVNLGKSNITSTSQHKTFDEASLTKECQ